MTERKPTVAFILPCVGRKNQTPYPRSWLMEPLAIAVLSALTPPSFGRIFYDDRLEDIPFDVPVDLAAISVETYTARRAYQIAAEYRKRGVPVVMGGFHATLAPDEVAQHADAIVIGEAETVWLQVLEDAVAGRLCPRYQASARPELKGVFPDRTIYSGKRYMDLALVETGRGCRHVCDFCSIAAFFHRSYSARPVEDVVQEVRSLRRRNIFFVDDNLAVDRVRTLALLQALEPLRIRWAGQVGVQIAGDDEILRAMHRSGCMGVLIGFESLQPESHALAGKGLREDPKTLYTAAMKQFARHRIAIYGTFVFGYDGDTQASVRDAMDFALRHRLFFAAFNHLVPFPGTPLHRRLSEEKRLVQSDWWLAPNYRFGDLAFRPARLTAAELAEACLRARRAFYAWPRILWRALNVRSNCRNPFMTATFLASNLMSRNEVDRRQGLPLGVTE
jgi:radical SAM superfamily enzyme YgiQ (UPF0313 family)